MKKRWISILLIIGLLGSFGACTPNEEFSNSSTSSQTETGILPSDSAENSSSEDGLDGEESGDGNTDLPIIPW